MSIIKIHHLNCTTFRLRFARAFDGQMGFFDTHLTCVTHCLLVETSNAGLVLVDTGFGMQDIDDPRCVTPIFHFVFRPPWKRGETAHAGIRALGLDPRDVRHIPIMQSDGKARQQSLARSLADLAIRQERVGRSWHLFAWIARARRTPENWQSPSSTLLEHFGRYGGERHNDPG